MITIKCNTPDTIRLCQLKNFQGDLKKRTHEDIALLCQSIREDGLLMPFVVWNDEGHLLDGHGRMEALIKMALDDPTILEQPLPVIKVQAESEAEAMGQLLQITSTYGKISKVGFAHFLAKTPDRVKVTAPIAIKLMGGVPKVVQPATTKTEDNTKIMHLKVRNDLIDRITEVLKGVDGVEIL